MKRTILWACAALALAACSKEENGGPADGRTELRLASGIEAVTRGDVQNDKIEPGETVWAWVSDAGRSGAEAALYNAERLTAQADGGLTGETPIYFPQTGGGVNIRALHGTFAGEFTEGETAFPASVGFTVAEDQSEGGDAYVKSDLLYAASDNVMRNGNPTTVPLKFYHLLSKLELKIVRGEGVTDAITRVTLDGVAVGGTFNPGSDLSTPGARAGMIKADAAQTATMTLGSAFWDEESKTTNDAIVVPQPIGGKTMTFTLASGGELVYTIPADKKFESGKKHVYTVTLKGTGLSVESTIEPWDGSEEEVEGDATLPVPAKIGDYFYSDGTYSTELDPAKTVIGIVFQTDPSRIGQAEKDALAAKGIDEPHGLVMAVKNAATSQAWGPSDTDEGLTKCESQADNYNDISGYGNCEHIRTNRGNFDDYPAFKAANEYNTVCPVPETTTGWYLPASGQWWDILQNLGGCPILADKSEQTKPGGGDFYWSGQGDVLANLNRWMAHIADENKNTFRSGDWFWSSSEYSIYNVWGWSVLSDGIVRCYRYSRGSNHAVRPVLAF